MRKFYSPLIQSIYRFNWQEIIQYVLLHIYTYIRYMYDIRYACMQTTAASAHFVCDCDCDCLCNASLCHFAGHLSAKQVIICVYDVHVGVNRYVDASISSMTRCCDVHSLHLCASDFADSVRQFVYQVVLKTSQLNSCISYIWMR